MKQRTDKGQFIKGVSYSPATQFKPGQHWRERKPYWDREWLRKEYVDKKRSAIDIAGQFGVTENAILFWIAKHKIPTRAMTEIRAVKHWGSLGNKNPMFGKRGILNKNWRGGLTPARQAIYSSLQWKQCIRAVYARDHVCRLCGEKKNTEIHHIDPFSQSPLLAMDIGNLILLCQKCHKKLRGKELKWKRKLFALLRGGDLSV